MSPGFSRHFDKDPRVLYLNSGTHSLCPREVLDAADRYRREYEANPTESLMAVWGKLWGVQGELARFLGARREDLFLRPNVTAVLNDLILGAPIERGAEILTTDLDYGAIVNTCRFRAERDGLMLRAVAPERLMDEIRPETRMLLVSHILTGTGEILPLRELAREARKRGIFLIVDGAHAPGAIPLDFKELEDVDAYGGNLHKWMMGPKGTSFGWVPERNHARIALTRAGWTTFGVIPPFDEFGGGDRFQEVMLGSACHDFSPYLAISDLLQFWEREGAGRIREQLYGLQAHAERVIDRELGWKKVSPPLGPRRGPLLAYEMPAAWQVVGFGWMRRLAHEDGLQVSITPVNGKWCMRFSPHAYNTEAEIDRGVALISRRDRDGRLS